MLLNLRHGGVPDVGDHGVAAVVLLKSRGGPRSEDPLGLRNTQQILNGVFTSELLDLQRTFTWVHRQFTEVKTAPWMESPLSFFPPLWFFFLNFD